MPVYEYQCDKCGMIEEAFQRMSDSPLSVCKHCSGHLHKIISQSSFHLKGSGWYVTDYAKNKGASSQSPSPPPKDSKKVKDSSSKSSDTTE